MSSMGGAAKSGLKKSLIFGGAVSASALAVGLGVAIPSYFKVQDELSKEVNNIVDLSRYLTELTSKLGVPPSAEFTQELEGGFQLIVKDGQTQIYRSNGDGEKVLVLNTNPDGSLSSAAQLEGPVAQEMISVLGSAQEQFARDQEAMDEILEQYRVEAEETSRRIESVTLGLDPDKGPLILEIKEAISHDDNIEQDNPLESQELNAIRQRESAINQAEWDDLVNQARDLKRNEIAAIEEAREHQEEIQSGSYTFTNPQFQALVSNVENKQSEIEHIQEESLENFGEANNAVTEISSERAFNGGQPTSNAVFENVVKDPASWMNMLTRGMGGNYYSSSAGGVTSAPSNLVRSSLYSTLLENHVDEENLQKVIDVIGGEILQLPPEVLPIEEFVSAGNEEFVPQQDREVSFSQVISPTPGQATNPLARLSAFKVLLKDRSSDVIDYGYMITHSGQGGESDIDQIAYFEPNSDETILIDQLLEILASGMCNDSPEGQELKRNIYSLFTRMISEQNPTIPSPLEKTKVDELISIYSYISRQSDLVKQELSGTFISLTNKIYFNSLGAVITFKNYQNTVEEIKNYISTTQSPEDVYTSFASNKWSVIFEMILVDDSQEDKDQLMINLVEFIDLSTEITTNYDFADELLNELTNQEIYNIVTDWSATRIEQLKNHYAEIKANTGSVAFEQKSENNKQLLLNMFKSPADSIQYTLEDMIRLSEKVGDYDITNPTFQEMIAETSKVSEFLASHVSTNGQKLDQSQIDQLTPLLDSIITKHFAIDNPNISKEQFDEIIKYTETVYAVFDNPVDIFEQLQKVFQIIADASTSAEVREICEKISTFNGWVNEIKTNGTPETSDDKTQVTMMMIKNYLWTINTHDIHAEGYSDPRGERSDGGPLDGPVTGAVIGDNGQVYTIGHTSDPQQGRSLQILVPGTDRTSTTVKSVLTDNALNAAVNGGNNFSSLSYVPNPNPSNGIIGSFYGMQLRGGNYYVRFDVHSDESYTFEEVHFTGPTWGFGSDGNYIGGINARNVVATPDGKYLYAIIDGTRDVYIIDLINNTSSKQTLDLSGGPDHTLRYGANGFVYNNKTYVVTASGTTGTDGQQIITIFEVGENGLLTKKSETDITDEIISTTRNVDQIVAIAIGEPLGGEIPIFALDQHGNLVKVVFNTATNAFNDSESMIIMTRVDLEKIATTNEYRGMVYANGAITMYGTDKVIYIVDADPTINEIFSLLMEH